MNDIPIAMDPAALREVGRHLGWAATESPAAARRSGASVADPAGDTAYQDFSSHWSGQLRELTRTVDQIAHRARLTALAFQLVDGA